MQLSDYARQVVPFYVMQVVREAAALAPQAAASGQPMIYLNVGEPDFTAPPLVQEAGEKVGKLLTKCLLFTGTADEIKAQTDRAFALAVAECIIAE